MSPTRPPVKDLNDLSSIAPKVDSLSTTILEVTEGGELRVRGQNGDFVARLLSAGAQFSLGVAETSGRLAVHDEAGRCVLQLDGAQALLRVGADGHGGRLRIIDAGGRTVLDFDPAFAALYVGANGSSGDVIVRNMTGNETIKLDGRRCSISVRDESGAETIMLDGKAGGLTIGRNGGGGRLLVLDSKGTTVLDFKSSVAGLYVGGRGNEGDVIVRDQNEKETVKIDGGKCSISMRDDGGTETVRIDGKAGDVILLGADCAEEFDILGAETVDPGTVLVIHEEGKLYPCCSAYDGCVAGVVSGANGVNPGIILGRGQSTKDRRPIALSGTVFCKVSADFSPVHVGDLLTTSPICGHAMKATDPKRAFGAVLGKALRSLPSGRGLIPILVSLQ